MHVVVYQPLVHLPVHFRDLAREQRRSMRGDSMKDKAPVTLRLDVEEIENRSKPGCSGSSSTSPLCTCPVGPGIQL